MEYTEYIKINRGEIEFCYDGSWLHLNPHFEDESLTEVYTSEKYVDVNYMADTDAEVINVSVNTECKEVVVTFDNNIVLTLDYDLNFLDLDIKSII